MRKMDKDILPMVVLLAKMKKEKAGTFKTNFRFLE